MDKSLIRLIWSAAVAFTFYFAWAYWANLGESIPQHDTLQAAFVQGSYSGFVTLIFTLIIEKLVARYGDSRISLAFITPILCRLHSKTKQNLAIQQSLRSGLEGLAGYFNRRDWRAAVLLPLVPVSVQASLVITVNWVNQTPNLWLTVVPSILFSSLYAFSYTFALLKQKSTTGV